MSKKKSNQLLLFPPEPKSNISDSKESIVSDSEKSFVSTHSIPKIHHISKFKEKKEKQEKIELYRRIIAMAAHMDDI